MSAGRPFEPERQLLGRGIERRDDRSDQCRQHGDEHDGRAQPGHQGIRDETYAAIDTKSRTLVAHIKVGPRPRSITFSKDGKTAFVTNETAATVGVIDTATHTLASTIELPPIEGAPTPPRPMGGALSPDGQQLFISLGRAGAVAVIDVAGRKLLRTIQGVGTRPWGIAVSADGRKLYTANGSSGDVSVIDLESGKVEKKIATGGSPWGVVVK